MELTVSKEEFFSWDHEGYPKWTAHTCNDNIVSVNFKGIGKDDVVQTEDEKFLRHIHKSLSDLFDRLDKSRNVGRIKEEF